MNLHTSSLPLAVIFTLISLCSSKIPADHPALLIVSFDGFRYDYSSRIKTPNIDMMRQIGAYGSLINVFETKTFPNHQSLATGLYPESHGVLANSVYDPLYNEVLNYGKKLWTFSEEVTPIWILNEMFKETRHSGVMMWPGGDFSYRNGVMPTFEQAWNASWDWSLRVDTVLHWFLQPVATVNLALLYIEEPDMHAHAFGPDSAEVANQVEKLDTLVGYLVRQLDVLNLTDMVNVFLVSDHGMDATDEQHIIDLTKVSNSSTYQIVGTSPVLHIIPHEGFEEQVYKELKNASVYLPMKIYNRQTVPARWYNKNCRRFPPILAVADEGYAFQDLRASIQDYANQYHFQPTPDHKYGLHGYDNTVKNMHPYFVAWGPNISQGIEIPPFHSVDLYSLWAHLLNIPESKAPSNGSFSSSSAINILREESAFTPLETNSLLVVLSVLGLGFVFGLAGYLVSRCCHAICKCGKESESLSYPTEYQRLDENGDFRRKENSVCDDEEADLLNSYFEEDEIEMK